MDVNLNKLFSEAMEIEKINNEFKKEGSDIIYQFRDKLNSISESPISVLECSDNYLKYCIRGIHNGYQSIYRHTLYASINELKNSIVKGKLTTGFDSIRIIDELTFEFDYYGKIYKDGIEYSFEQFHNQYWVNFNNYLLKHIKK